jgi:hypothetical protein
MRTARAAAGGVSRRGGEVEASGRRPTAGVLALDVLAVLLLAAVGRRTHAEGLSVAGVLGTAWPFLTGTATGWAVARAWRRPTSGSTGVLVWAATVVAGMALRRLTGDGTATAFVVVATATLGVLLLGWRAVVVAVAPRLGRRQKRPEALGR